MEAELTGMVGLSGSEGQEGGGQGPRAALASGKIRSDVVGNASGSQGSGTAPGGPAQWLQ